MLTLRPKGWWGGTYLVRDEAQQQVAELSIGFLVEHGRISTSLGDYAVRREGLLRGPFCLESQGGVVARAHKHPLRQIFEIDTADRRYLLRRLSFWSGEYALLDGERKVASLYRPMLLRRAQLAAGADLALPVQLFLLRLMLLVWKRASSS